MHVQNIWRQRNKMKNKYNPVENRSTKDKLVEIVAVGIALGGVGFLVGEGMEYVIKSNEELPKEVLKYVNNIGESLGYLSGLWGFGAKTHYNFFDKKEL